MLGNFFQNDYWHKKFSVNKFVLERIDVEKQKFTNSIFFETENLN